MIEILRAGPLTTVQDLGRPGQAHLGVGRAGAADRPSLRLANRLVGNPEDAAALEVTLGGLAIRVDEPTAVAVTGAACPVEIDGRPAEGYAVLRLPAGARLELGAAAHGIRAYVAVRGGLDRPMVLGSRATDLRSGIGPERVRDGDRLPVGPDRPDIPAVDIVPLPAPVTEPVLRVRLGPRDDWFDAAAAAALTSASYAVLPDSDRVGVRLRGPLLTRLDARELPSEGMVEGALQVPPDGQPVLFLADHPVTGGYPVIAVVHLDDLPAAAQVRPGQTLRFRVG